MTKKNVKILAMNSNAQLGIMLDLNICSRKIMFEFNIMLMLNIPMYHRNIEGIFRKYSIKILQCCKNIYKAVRMVSKIFQEPCNVRSKYYKWNIAAILIFHFNIAVM